MARRLRNINLKHRGRVLLAVAVGGVALAVAVPAVDELTTPDRQAAGGGQFFINCGGGYASNLQSPIDPIVAPGVDPFGHEHSFQGGSAIIARRADVTADDLIAGGTNCAFAPNHSSMWHPSLKRISDGATVEPFKLGIYYRNPMSTSAVAFPKGFKMIAGDKNRTTYTTGGGWGKVLWSCNQGGNAQTTNNPHNLNCIPDNRGMTATLRFQNCWDQAQGLDSATHQAHVAYPSPPQGGGVCPPSHPTVVPQVEFIMVWPVASMNGYRLSSDAPGAANPGASMHADYLFAWLPGTLEHETSRCLNAGVQCGVLSGPGTPSPPPPQQTQCSDLIDNDGAEGTDLDDHDCDDPQDPTEFDWQTGNP